MQRRDTHAQTLEDNIALKPYTRLCSFYCMNRNPIDKALLSLCLWGFPVRLIPLKLQALKGF